MSDAFETFISLMESNPQDFEMDTDFPILRHVPSRVSIWVEHNMFYRPVKRYLTGKERRKLKIAVKKWTDLLIVQRLENEKT